MRASSVSVLAALVTIAASADAAPPARATAKNPPAPPPPAASVTLTLEAPSPSAPWKIRVENTGTVPLRLSADARLVTLEITPPPSAATPDPKSKKAPGPPKPVRCALPADMRPMNDTDRALVVPPKRSYSERFDPRIYCFGAAEAKALVAGASVTAHMGFAPTHKPKANEVPPPPYVVSPFEGVEPAVSPLKEIASAPVTIGSGDAPAPSASASASAAPSATPPSDAFPARMSVTVPARERTASPRDLSIPVTLRNDGVRPVTILFRPETLAFDVNGPDGPVRCSWPQPVGGTVREMYTHLAPHASASQTVLLSAYCPRSVFERSGLYTVKPRVDTRGGAAETIGVRAFEGEVVGEKTMLLRVERGRSSSSERPHLDP